MTYSTTDLLQIYHRMYTHVILTAQKTGDMDLVKDHMMELMEFANDIVIRPEHVDVQQKAASWENDLTEIHASMMSGLQLGKWTYPCKCLHGFIKRQMEHWEEKLNSVEKGEDFEEQRRASDLFIRWSSYYYRIQ